MKTTTETHRVSRVSNAEVAGLTPINTKTVDMANFSSATWVVLFGTISAGGVQGIKVQGGEQSDGSDAADLEGTLVSVTDAQSNFAAVVEVTRPRQRYLRAVVTRATANSVVDGVLCLMGVPADRATVDDSVSVAASKVVPSPPAGTA